jgi:cyclic pyranopterin phosphate synthase
VSQHFCASCNRVRLSVDGVLHLCLGQENRVSLLGLLREGWSDEDIAERIRLAVLGKPEKHEFVEAPGKLVRIMASTGG